MRKSQNACSAYSCQLTSELGSWVRNKDVHPPAAMWRTFGTVGGNDIGDIVVRQGAWCCPNCPWLAQPQPQTTPSSGKINCTI